MAVQRTATVPYTDADALLSAVLQSEIKVEEELRRLTGGGQNEELQEALRKLAEKDAEVEAAQHTVEKLKDDGLAKWGPKGQPAWRAVKPKSVRKWEEAGRRSLLAHGTRR